MEVFKKMNLTKHGQDRIRKRIGINKKSVEDMQKIVDANERLVNELKDGNQCT